MLRSFWCLVGLQVILVLTLAIEWPVSASVWLIGIVGYLLLSVCLMHLGLKLAKYNKSYYLITIAGTSFNWVLFGGLGVMISFIAGVINLSTIF